jgi:hypothetical protein
MTHDEWRLLGYGMLTAFLMALFLVPIFLRNMDFPKLAAEAILGAIALAVFLLSKYRQSLCGFSRENSTEHTPFASRTCENTLSFSGS